MTDILLIANHAIYANPDFIVLDEIDPKTGEFKIQAVPRITQPGEWVSFPADEARRLIDMEAAREPTEREWELRRLSGAPPLEGERHA